MPYIKVYIHFVWSTKNRFPYLATREIRQKVWHHIKEYAKTKNIFVDYVNGYFDHCHCLVSMKSNQNIEEIAKLIKGESSFWINHNEEISKKINPFLGNEKFDWQDEYYAVSVSESMIERVRNYIKNQEIHHQNKSFSEEYEELIMKYGFKKSYDKNNDKNF